VRGVSLQVLKGLTNEARAFYNVMASKFDFWIYGTIED
jgi:hypothetical protein